LPLKKQTAMNRVLNLQGFEVVQVGNFLGDLASKIAT